MTSLLDALKESTLLFQAQGVLDPRRQAEELFCAVLGFNHSFLYLNRHQQLNEKEVAQVQACLARRLTGEPLAYILGRVDFYGCTIQLNPAVLIPRQETEILVDKVVQSLAKQELHGKVLWDLCCGSGCIGIALKKRFPCLTVVLADLSSDALVLARQNAQDNQVEVRCVQGDLLEPLAGEKAHFCICNPPYISEEEYKDLDGEVKDFEPRLALVGGETGMEFYERLARELPSHLYPQANVWLEIGYQQGSQMKELFQGPPWKRQFLENDWAGHSRFFFLENE